MENDKTSTSVERPLFVASLNCLGDSLNPLEFMQNDDSFQASYTQLEEAAQRMTWDEFTEICGESLLDAHDPNIIQALDDFKAYCQTNKSPWSYFAEDEGAEDRLEQDNKLQDGRINMIVFAFHSVPRISSKFFCEMDKLTEDLSEEGILEEERKTLNPAERKLSSSISWHSTRSTWREIEKDHWKRQWRLVDNGCWRTALAVLRDDKNSDYHSPGGAELYVWDLLCNVIVSQESEEFRNISMNSHLNPENFATSAANFVKEIVQGANGGQIALGLQEWPSSDSPKGKAFNQVFHEHGLNVIRGQTSVAFAYNGDPDRATMIDLGGDEVINELMGKCIDQGAEKGIEISQKVRKGLLATTVKKVMAVRMDGTNYIVMHAKDPSTYEGANVLARFVLSIGRLCGDPWVCCVDANTGHKSISGFHEFIRLSGLDLSQYGNTTAKKRSVLHGQCYDKKKCKKSVRAPKDHIIGPKDSLSKFGFKPDLESDEQAEVRWLPTHEWASDHCLCYATYTKQAQSEDSKDSQTVELSLGDSETTESKVECTNLPPPHDEDESLPKDFIEDGEATEKHRRCCLIF